MMRLWGRLLVALGLLLAGAGNAQAAWWQAKTDHFTVYSEGSDDKLRDFAERLEKFDYLLRKMTGKTAADQTAADQTAADRGSPVKVYLLSSEAKVKNLARNPNIAGFYTTSDRSAYAFLSRSSKGGMFGFDAEQILFHEYTHHFMLHYFPAAYPAWYVEGFAEYFSVVDFPKDGSIRFAQVPMARVPGLVLGQPYPLKQLFAQTTDGLNRADGDRYYGTAWLLTHYYFNAKTGRSAELSRYLNDLARGEAGEPDSYFAGGLEGLEKDLKAYMRHRTNMLVLRPGEMQLGAITVSPADAADGALIEDELHLIHRPRTEDLPDLVSSIRATAAKFPQSAAALALLAEAEWKADMREAALADADRAIAIDPQSSRAYAVRAQAMLDRAHDSDNADDWKAALTAIVRANRADTEDPLPLALFYRYHAMRGGKMPDLGYDGLYKAYTLLPQNPDYRFNLANALAIRGDYEAASTLLDPIAYSPHGSDMRDAALRLKARFDAQAAEKGAQSRTPAP